jgi:hypothetical protein
VRSLTIIEAAMTNTIIAVFPTTDHLLNALDIEIERTLLRHVVEYTKDKMHPMVTCGSVATELFGHGGYVYDAGKRRSVETRISRAWKALEDANLIEPPDIDNGRNGYRVVTDKGRSMDQQIDFEAAKVRGCFTRAMFHPALPASAWNAFRAGDYDLAVFDAFRAVEAAVRNKGRGKNGILETDCGAALMKKAFDPDAGPLSDMTAARPRRSRRCELFCGAFGELRNPKAHGDPTIADPLMAVEELMTAGALQRIVDHA